MVLDDGHELASAVDLDSRDLEEGAGEQLVEQAPCGAGGCGGRDVADRPFGDRVVGGEVLDGLVGSDVDEEGVDLDEFAEGLGFSALDQALGVALACVEAEAPAAGLRRRRHANDDAAIHQPFEDAPDLADADVLPLAVEERSDLALAHIGLSARTASARAGGHLGYRTRLGLRERGSGAFSHR
jgi:hypothetical protein